MNLMGRQAQGVVIRAVRCALLAFRHVPAGQPGLQMRLRIHSDTAPRPASPAVTGQSAAAHDVPLGSHLDAPYLLPPPDFVEVCGGIAAFAAFARLIARLLLMCCYEVTHESPLCNAAETICLVNVCRANRFAGLRQFLA